MPELVDIVLPPGAPKPITVRSARVIAVNGHVLQVDLGGPVQAYAGDGCNPRPNDTVLLVVDGQTLTAVAVLNGPYRQATITVTASTSTTVTGLINGTAQTIPKSGAFTVSNGQVCPLFWSADGARVWALANEQSATVAPPAGDGGGSAPGGSQIGTSVYPARASGQYRSVSGDWAGGAPTTTPAITGAFFYGANRFKELQGRTIRSCRIYLPGSGSPTVWGHPHAARPVGAPTLAYNAGARSLGGWVTVPTALAAYLISGTGTGGIAFTIGAGLAQIQGLPNGQIEIGWRV